MQGQQGGFCVIDLYGISSCDSVRKARAWLEAQGIDHAFHDYRKDGADPGRLARWAQAAGWTKLLNTRGTTFRKLPASDREGIDAARALALMAAHPSLIRRPVAEYAAGQAGEIAGDNASGLLVGFDAEAWSAALVRR